MTDSKTGVPISDAVVFVDGISRPTNVYPQTGNFYFLLAAGTYKIQAKSEGYIQSSKFTAFIPRNQSSPVVINFVLVRDSPVISSDEMASNEICLIISEDNAAVSLKAQMILLLAQVMMAIINVDR